MVSKKDAPIWRAEELEAHHSAGRRILLPPGSRSTRSRLPWSRDWRRWSRLAVLWRHNYSQWEQVRWTTDKFNVSLSSPNTNSKLLSSLFNSQAATEKNFGWKHSSRSEAWASTLRAHWPKVLRLMVKTCLLVRNRQVGGEFDNNL